MPSADPAVRALLSPAARELFDDVDLQRVLGASTHIRLIGDMLLDLADQGLDTDDLVEAVKRLQGHFTATRGASSQAISNALALMTAGLGTAGRSPEEQVRDGVTRFRERSAEDLKKIDAYLWSVAEDMDTILLFDYSSTVCHLAALGKQHGKSFRCVIPESRGLDGGRPYVRPFLEAGHTVRFIPDSALCHFLPGCDGVFFGSETYYPDGTCFNTVGSELCGLLCREFKVPLYVPTPLLKLDGRALHGYKKPPILDDHTERMAAHWTPEERRGVDFTCPELVPIPPACITAYITEEGILPPWAMYPASLRYQEKLMGGMDG